MKNDQNKQAIDWEYVHHMLDGQAEERELLQAAGEEEQRLLKEINSIRLHTRDLQGWEGVNTSEDLAKVKARLSLPEQAPVMIPVWRKALRYAAIISLPLAVGIGAWLLLKPGKVADSTSPAYAIVEVPKQETREITLPDGTKVWLNAGSSLRYPQIFTGKEKVVEMTGEACFSATADPAHPFIVKTGQQTVQVLGTLFNINAYGNTIVTTLASGKIALHTTGEARGMQYLHPGQQAVFNALTGHVAITPGDSATAFAWRSGQIAFTNVPLPDLVEQLGLLYNYDVTLKNDSLQHLHYNVPLMPKPGDILPLLELIRATTATPFGFDIDTVKRTIEIR